MIILRLRQLLNVLCYIEWKQFIFVLLVISRKTQISSERINKNASPFLRQDHTTPHASITAHIGTVTAHVAAITAYTRNVTTHIRTVTAHIHHFEPTVTAYGKMAKPFYEKGCLHPLIQIIKRFASQSEETL